MKLLQQCGKMLLFFCCCPCLQQQPPSNSKAIAGRQFFSRIKVNPTNYQLIYIVPYPLALQVQSFPPNLADKSRERFERHLFWPAIQKVQQLGLPPRALAGLRPRRFQVEHPHLPIERIQVAPVLLTFQRGFKRPRPSLCFWFWF